MYCGIQELETVTDQYGGKSVSYKGICFEEDTILDIADSRLTELMFAGNPVKDLIKEGTLSKASKSKDPEKRSDYQDMLEDYLCTNKNSVLKTLDRYIVNQACGEHEQLTFEAVSMYRQKSGYEMGTYALDSMVKWCGESKDNFELLQAYIRTHLYEQGKETEIPTAMEELEKSYYHPQCLWDFTYALQNQLSPEAALEAAKELDVPLSAQVYLVYVQNGKNKICGNLEEIEKAIKEFSDEYSPCYAFVVSPKGIEKEGFLDDLFQEEFSLAFKEKMTKKTEMERG